ncbi:MAG TPA: glycosyltransferase family 2 protein [Rhizomicrobium sp.]|jgi:glycosyltransferase involved in cell wall biosynthesis
MTACPKISVITVNFNMAAELPTTLGSVLEQDYPNLESIVIDGGSTDGSREVITAYGPRLGYWVSERDRSLYDGMNKGVAVATGEWVLFMNSGDRFASSTVLSEMFRGDHAGADIVYGDYIRIYPDRGISRVIRAEKPSILPLRMNCSHQSLFMRREILLNRPFAMEFLAADYDSILAAYVNGKTFKHVGCVVSVAAVGGRSDRYRLTMLAQRITIVRRHNLLSLRVLLQYFWLMVRVIVTATLKAMLPRPVTNFILRHRSIRGLG